MCNLKAIFSSSHPECDDEVVYSYYGGLIVIGVLLLFVAVLMILLVHVSLKMRRMKR